MSKRDQRTKSFPFVLGFSEAARRDEVTFGCSINFKGFYTIKHNLSSPLSFWFPFDIFVAQAKFLYFHLVY